MRDKGYRGLPARDARRVLSSRFRKLSRQLRQVTRTKPAKQAGCTHAHVRARQRGNCLLHHPRIAPSGDARSLIPAHYYDYSAEMSLLRQQFPLLRIIREDNASSGPGRGRLIKSAGTRVKLAFQSTEG